MPTKNQSLLWDGILFVRSGPFKAGIFRFTLQLDPGFPLQNSPPMLKLLDPVLHPLVAEETLIFDSSPAFPIWSENDHIYELLKFFKYAMENLDYCCNQVQRPTNTDAVE